ncbi:MAG: undecaprenyl/decaprenyl-phosphate alpha-N-acetylglucosaminyl 1-phosphate transferase, partial [Chloroflexus sp.]|nr:undecaprenyl/decaprenyl-phosphate alpha-N-acetylglucosaminyl 1-phosphate transferase [Chloroflexus sp.]
MLTIFAIASIPLVAFAITTILVPPLIRLARQEGWVAHPGPRHVHREPTPVVGGLAIIAGLVGALVMSIGVEAIDPVLRRSPFEHLR